ncbi:MAG: CotH kinase family protein [Bacteroidales bacterium]
MMKFSLTILLVILLGISSQMSFSQVVINEYSCSNLSQFPDNYGKFEDWFELYNAGTAAVNLSGYYLSDDSLNNLKWQIPAGISITAGGFKRFWASGRDLVVGSSYHTSFKLTQTKNNPEFIVLSNPSGIIIDQVKLSKKTHLGHSRGRTLNGAASWSVFVNPTPNLSNNSATPYVKYADRPDMSMPAGFYNGAITVVLSTTEPNADIHYTIDGTEPGLSSPIYSAPINVSATKVIKAISVSSDPEILTSLVEFNTYFINVNHSVVVLSVAGTQLDVLANGNSGIEPKGSFEYFNLEQERVATTYGEYNKHGQDSWAHSHRSIDFVSRDEMAYNHSIEEMMFNWTPRNNFQRIILRAAGDDNYPADHSPANEGSAHIRDAYIHSLADLGGLHLNVRRSEKSVVYLNGQYWGVYDIREKPDDHDYCEYYYGQDKYHLQFLLYWGGRWAEYGGNQAGTDWDTFYNYMMGNNPNVPSVWQYIDQRFDYKSLADYIIVNSLTVCSDWLNWNVGWWRGLDSLGGHLKWGYILWDNDATFGHYINYTQIPNTTPQALPCNAEGLGGSSDPEGHVALLNHLRQNPDFDRYYKTRQIDLWNTVFSCENMLAQLDSTEALIDPEMTGQANRWSGTYSEWKSNALELRSFISQRCTYLSTGFMNCYNLTGPYNIVVKVDPPEAGSVIFNSLPLVAFPWTGTYFGNILTLLKAWPNAGYEFDHWSSASQVFQPNANVDSVSVNLTNSDTITAHFSLWSGITPVFSNVNVLLYPNLISSVATLYLDLPYPMPVSVKLLSPLGQELIDFKDVTANYSGGKQNITLDLGVKSLKAGSYLLDVRTGDQRKCFKVIYSPF